MRPEEILQLARDFFRIPGPPLQKRWAQEWEDVTVHTQGKYPKKLIDERRPYEDEVIKDYRKKNWRAITKDAFNRALTNLQRILGKSQVSIEYPEPLKEYLTSRVFAGTDFDGFFNRFVIRRMIDDANGVLVWWPLEIPQPNIPIEPRPFMVLSKNIKHFNDKMLSWLAPEKSPVRVAARSGNGTEIRDEGEVYYIVTRTHYLKMVQVGDKAKRDFELRVHYVHNLNTFPFIVLGGEETMRTNKASNEDDVWFTTYFSAAIPFADECLNQFSDHQGIMVTSTSPIREVDAPDCTARGCKGGWIDVPADMKTVEGATLAANFRLVPGTKLRQVECGTCHGSGKILPTGPFGVMWRRQASLINDGDRSREVPVMRFLSPDVNIVKYSGDYWRELRKDVDRALNLLFIDEAQSGVAKTIDREDKVSTLDRIGQHFYMTLVRTSIILIGRLRNVTFEDDDVIITLPPSFVVKSEEDLFTSMKGMRDNGMSSLYAIAGSLELARQKFPGNVRLHKMGDVLAQYDPLFGMTPADKVEAEGLGTIDAEMSRRSLLAPTALLRLVTEDAGILDKEFTEIEAAIDDVINGMAPDPPPAVQKVDDERKAAEAAAELAKKNPPVPPGTKQPPAPEVKQ